MIDEDASTPGNIVTKIDDHRRSERVLMGPHYQTVCKIVESTFKELAEKCAGEKMDWYEPPQLLRYNPGGYYYAHADSEHLDPNNRTWHKVIDRDLSLLIYLNSTIH